MFQKLIDRLIFKLAKWILPLPILGDILGELLVRYKLQVISTMAFVVLIPFGILSVVFSSPLIQGEAASAKVIQRQFFDSKYNVECLNKIVTCEPKAEYINQVIDCTIEPTKCRKVRATGDCSNEIFKTKYCAETSSTTTTTNPDGTSSTETTTSFIKKPNADKEYYDDQQMDEENLFFKNNTNSENVGYNPFLPISELSSLGGSSNVNWKDPSNAPSIGSIPNSIKDYTEPNFSDSGAIQSNPFGKFGYSYTCRYLCYSNSTFGTHYGTDIKPTQTYYTSNEASQKLNGKPVFFATCSGTAKVRYTSVSGNMLELKCKDSNYWVSYYHIREYYMPAETYTTVIAGQPIGVMGGEAGAYWSGAFTTGPHLHYQVNFNCLSYSAACTQNADNFVQ